MLDTKRDLEGLKLDSTFYYCIAFEKLCFNNQDRPVRDFLINQIVNSSRVFTIVRRKSLRTKDSFMYACMYVFIRIYKRNIRGYNSQSRHPRRQSRATVDAPHRQRTFSVYRRIFSKEGSGKSLDSSRCHRL